MLDTIFYHSGRAVVNMYAMSMLKRDVRWPDSLPDGPKIIAANHPTTTDPFFITTLLSEQMSILVTGGAFDIPLFGHYLHLAGHVPVIRGNGGTPIEQAKSLLKSGRTVVIFPEGALSPFEGGFHQPHSGVGRLALSTGAPVIPVGIHPLQAGKRIVNAELEGKDEVGILFLRGSYGMTVGEAMRFSGDVEDYEHVRSVSKSIMQRIIHLSQQSAMRVEPLPALTPTLQAKSPSIAAAR
jgi:1-acyl-sn-glycerol-3-phosphate acyltransferase